MHFKHSHFGWGDTQSIKLKVFLSEKVLSAPKRIDDKNIIDQFFSFILKIMYFSYIECYYCS